MGFIDKYGKQLGRGNCTAKTKDVSELCMAFPVIGRFKLSLIMYDDFLVSEYLTYI